MLTVRFFASLRERLNADCLTSPWVADIEALIDVLSSEHGAHWANELRAEQVIVAVNQRVADHSAALHDGDEVAFFPPVTGG